MRWKSYLLWEAMPLCLLLLSLVFLVCYNWPYESKLFLPSQNESVGYMGPILLIVALILALFAGGLLFLLRFLWPRPDGKNNKWWLWLIRVPLGLVVLFQLVRSLSIVW